MRLSPFFSFSCVVRKHTGNATPHSFIMILILLRLLSVSNYLFLNQSINHSGDAFADLFCFMTDGFPPAGGDVRVKHPSKCNIVNSRCNSFIQ